MGQINIKSALFVFASMTILSLFNFAQAMSCKKPFVEKVFDLRIETRSAASELRSDLKQLSELSKEYHAAAESSESDRKFAKQNGLPWEQPGESAREKQVLRKISEIVGLTIKRSNENAFLLLQYLNNQGLELGIDLKAVTKELQLISSVLTKQIENPKERELLSSITQWGGFFQSSFKLGETIKLIREKYPALIKEDEFQKLYQATTLGNIQYIIFQDTVVPLFKMKKSSFTEINLPDFFARFLIDYYDIAVYYVPGGYLSAPPLKIKVFSQLFTVLMVEIINNAQEAARRRHGDKWNHSHVPQINAFEKADRSLEVTIEDFGQPSELDHSGQLGRTTNTLERGRKGLGFGLFYIQLIADTLGYNLNYSAKKDGSGTLVTIQIPPSSKAKSL